MTSPGRRPTRLVAGALLMALGAVAWVLGAVLLRGEPHSFGSGQPPRQVTLTRGATYWIGLAGGVDKEIAAGVAPAALRCTLTDEDGAALRLALSVEQRDTKATEQIASFISPVSGRARVSCAGLSGAGVDTATGDPSGYLIALAALALAIGAPVTLSALRGRATRAARPIRVGAHSA